MDKMELFRKRYLNGQEDRELTVFDLGSMAVGGSYRAIFSKERWRYTGLDLTKGENVDLVLSDPYNWLEIDSESVDVLVSGQAFEHIEYFWETIREIARILKPGGLCCIIAPSGGPEHKYPVDCWRFYPDGFRALSRYAGLELLEVTTQWKPEGYSDDSDMWQDTMFVGRKSEIKLDVIEDKHDYRREIKEDSEDSLSKIIRHITPNSRVLELGPATGYLTRYLKEKMGCLVDCVEISAEMAKEAEKFSNRMIVGNLDTIVLEDEFGKESYDYIILADVLEHLKKGERTLKSCRKLLKEAGRCILSIPNIAHASIIGGLLKGQFEYTDEGILDRTHVRFFTRSSIQRLLSRCGFGVEKIEAVVKLPEDTEIGDSLMSLPFDLQKKILTSIDALAYQFVIVSQLTEDKSPLFHFNGALYDTGTVDLRRLAIANFEERLAEVENGLVNAQKLAYERLDYIKELEKALHEAQTLAFERMDRLIELDEKVQQMQAKIQEYELNIVNRIWKKVLNILARYRL